MHACFYCTTCQTTCDLKHKCTTVPLRTCIPMLCTLLCLHCISKQIKEMSEREMYMNKLYSRCQVDRYNLHIPLELLSVYLCNITWVALSYFHVLTCRFTSITYTHWLYICTPNALPSFIRILFAVLICHVECEYIYLMVCNV